MDIIYYRQEKFLIQTGATFELYYTIADDAHKVASSNVVQKKPQHQTVNGNQKILVHKKNIFRQIP